MNKNILDGFDKPYRLYIGSRDYKPEGYITVDLNLTYKSDIVCDVLSMPNIPDYSIYRDSPLSQVMTD